MDIPAACVIALFCIVGLVSNIVSAVVLTRNRVFRNPFGMLTAIHTVANVGVLLIFAFWAVPLMLSNSPTNPNWNNRLGQLSLFFVEAAFHACLFISLNRLAAIFSPSFYRNRFTIKATIVVIFFCLLVSLCYACVYFFPECDFYFDSTTNVWTFADTKCGSILAKYCDMAYNVTLFAFVGCVDLTTLFLLRGANQKLGGNTETSRRRNRREIRFFAQAFTNTVIYAFMLICFHILSYKITSPFGIFLATTGVWGFSHACGGVILVAFNKEIRRVFADPTRFWSHMLDTKSQSQITVTAVRRSDVVSIF